MRLIAIIIMKIMLIRAKKDMFACDNRIIKKAYSNMIKNYENTIMFLKADMKKDKIRIFNKNSKLNISDIKERLIKYLNSRLRLLQSKYEISDIKNNSF